MQNHFKKYSDYLDEASIQFVQDKNPTTIINYNSSAIYK